jgi:sulfur-oxidizing protein SoxA
MWRPFSAWTAASAALLWVTWMMSLQTLAQAQTRSGASTAEARRSGFDFMGPATQAMQRDDAQNPGMLWVKEGAALWQKAAGKTGQSCASCHGEAASSMRGVATRYPRFDAASARPINLGQKISQCREQRQQGEALAPESNERLSLESFVAHQSRGLPLAPPSDRRLAPFTQSGQQRYTQRIGQLNLSCALCHDEQAGKRLAGALIPQAHASGYPTYRLEWQGIGSLQRRLRSCIAGVRAEAPPYDAQALVELELYLAARGAGMPVETPAVRP